MESSRVKTEVIKPVFLVVGIPLAFSLASVVLGRIKARKSSSLKASMPDIHLNTLESNSLESDLHELPRDAINLEMRNSGKEEILSLGRKVKELQERELMIEARFIRYHELKEREFVLMELENSLLLELARAEFMDREVSSMEADSEKFEEMVKMIHKALEELESFKSENVMLQPKIKKLLKGLKGCMHVVSEDNLREAMETVISCKDMELVRKAETIKKLDDEMEELRMGIQSLQEEKNELLKKLEIAESSPLRKSKSGKETIKDYDKVVKELEQLQKDRAAEMQELIYLRWSNACLRHELFRRNQEEGKKTEAGNFGLADESGSSSNSVIVHDDPSNSFRKGKHGYSIRPKLFEKFKKWVESGKIVTKQKLEEKKKPELKYFGSHSVAHFGD